MAKDWYKKYKNLRFEMQDHGVLLISIDRPEKMNATDGPTHNGLSRVWLDVGDDPDVRVVVVTGAGDAFSAGGDLDWIESMVNNYDVMREVFREAGDIVYRMVQ